MVTVCNFDNYFELMNHDKNKRNNTVSIKLPKAKLACAKKAFFFTGAKVYNRLSISIRNQTNFNTYIKSFYLEILNFNFYLA